MEKLAAVSGVSLGTIHNLETGNFKRGPSADTVAKLASALGCEWVSFFGQRLQENTEHALASDFATA
jgi:transcriptional regulator with XRE-family HTH domain